MAYAFSPIDLIPDFIPVLGYLDDLLIIPLGVYLALKMIPAPIIAENRAKAALYLEQPRPQFKIMAIIIIAIWVIVLLVVGGIIYNQFVK